MVSMPGPSLKDFIKALSEGATVVIHPNTYEMFLEKGVDFDRVYITEYVQEGIVYALKDPTWPPLQIDKYSTTCGDLPDLTKMWYWKY